MTLNSIMASATSGMSVAQTGLSTVSDNISNVNTPGYVRKIVDQSSLVSQGAGVGVSVAQIRRAADQYLQTASLNASSTSGASSAVSDLLDQAQSAFGDPSASNSYFNQLNSVFSAFTAAANNPASNLSRSQTLDQITSFLDATKRISSSMQALSQQADTRIGSDVDQVNQLLSQIDSLNTDITRTLANGADSTGSLDAQSELVDKLSSLMDINISPRTGGGVILRTGTGALLAGDGGGPASLAYLPSGSGAGKITLTQSGAAVSTSISLGNGELKGLIDVRDNQLPAIQDQLGEFVSKTVDALNQAHNGASAVPPPALLTGRNTGLDQTTALSGFSGVSTIAIVDGAGQLQRRVDIDFTAGTMSVNGAAGTPFGAATFAADLTAALGPAGTASFTNGALSIKATVPGTGVAITDNAATPSLKAGRGFSQYLGLNDLITTSGISNYATGLKASDLNGFTPGDTMTLRLSDPRGGVIRDVTVAVPPAGSPTMQDLINSLNTPVGGVGQYGQFSLDPQGQLSFASNTPGAVSLSVLDDRTQRGVGGPSVTQLFGIGAAQRAGRASTFSIRTDIAQNPMNLALAQLNFSGAVGQPVLALGDNSGALKLAQAADATMPFSAAGDFGAMSTSATQYASLLGGSLGRKAAGADDAKTAADAVKSEANTRRQSVEGVNLDEELVNLTTYQQAYSASARLIQTVKDMYDTLLAMAR